MRKDAARLGPLRIEASGDSVSGGAGAVGDALLGGWMVKAGEGVAGTGRVAELAGKAVDVEEYRTFNAAVTVLSTGERSGCVG